MSKYDIDEVVARVDNITTLPSTVTEIIRICENPKSQIVEMENAILKDQALTSRVLRLANSAYYGYARRISTVSQAAVLLGFNTIKSMVIALSVNSMMDDPLEGYALDKDELWLKSQSSAIIARYIAQVTIAHDPEEAYVAALLKDVGMTALNEYMKIEYQEVIRVMEDNQETFCFAENEVFGFTHADVGAEIAKNWNLPDALVDTIRNHHHPENSAIDDKSLISIVHLADAMTMMLGIGIGVAGLAYPISPLAIETLDLDTEKFSNIISEIADLIQDPDSFNVQ